MFARGVRLEQTRFRLITGPDPISLEVIRQEAIEYDEDPEESASTLLDRAQAGAVDERAAADEDVEQLLLRRRVADVRSQPGIGKLFIRAEQSRPRPVPP